MKKNILLADDDASIRFVISKSLTRAGYNVRATDNAATLMKWIKSGEGDLVLSDVHMGQEDFFNFVPELKKLRPELPIIVISANTSVMTALKSGKFGVFEYIPKPFDLNELQSAIERGIATGAGPRAADLVSHITEIEHMIGKSEAMQPVFRSISDFMSGDIPVFISGDVGTGKNLTAELIHNSGRRKAKPFVELSDFDSAGTLLASVSDGDLLIDRIEDLSANQQSLLLNVLEKNEKRPEADRFRVLCISNLTFEQLKSNLRIRPELYSHLIGGHIQLPTLSERRQDIEDLAKYFINQDPNSKIRRKFSPSALKLLVANQWSGNVRELRNLVRSIPLQYADALITDQIIKTSLQEQSKSLPSNTDYGQLDENMRKAVRTLLLDAIDSEPSLSDAPYTTALSWIEKPLIEEALKLTHGNNVKASELLGIHRNTLRTKIRSLGIGKNRNS